MAVPSIKPRGNGAGNADTRDVYLALCAKHNTVPLRLLGAHLADRVLALQVDRLRAYDWEPFLGALQQTKPAFERVSVASQHFAGASVESRGWPRSRPPPALFEARSPLPLTLFTTLRDCLYGSARLTSLVVDGVPLSAAMARALVDGLAGPRALTELRLRGCQLGDDMLADLCLGLRRHTRLVTLDLARNNLGPAAFESVAVLLNGWATANDTKHWEQTLRAGPSRELPPRPSAGVAALELSGNPGAGDRGVAFLVAVLERPGTRVTRLALADCGVTAAAVTLLYQLFQTRSEPFEELDLCGHKCPDTGLLERLGALLQVRYGQLVLRPATDPAAADAGRRAAAVARRRLAELLPPKPHRPVPAWGPPPPPVASSAPATTAAATRAKSASPRQTTAAAQTGARPRSAAGLAGKLPPAPSAPPPPLLPRRPTSASSVKPPTSTAAVKLRDETSQRLGVQPWRPRTAPSAQWFDANEDAVADYDAAGGADFETDSLDGGAVADGRRRLYDTEDDDDSDDSAIAAVPAHLPPHQQPRGAYYLEENGATDDEADMLSSIESSLLSLHSSLDRLEAARGGSPQ